MEGKADIYERISYIRSCLKMSQEKFALSIGVTNSTVSLIERGKRNPSDRIIRDICREFNVNEEWLRTGEGDMFVTMSPSDEFVSYCKDICMGKSKLMESIIIEFMKLDEVEKATVQKLFVSVAERMHQ